MDLSKAPGSCWFKQSMTWLPYWGQKLNLSFAVSLVLKFLNTEMPQLTPKTSMLSLRLLCSQPFWSWLTLLAARLGSGNDGLSAQLQHFWSASTWIRYGRYGSIWHVCAFVAFPCISTAFPWIFHGFSMTSWSGDNQSLGKHSKPFQYCHSRLVLKQIWGATLQLLIAIIHGTIIAPHTSTSHT